MSTVFGRSDGFFYSVHTYIYKYVYMFVFIGFTQFYCAFSTELRGQRAIEGIECHRADRGLYKGHRAKLTYSDNHFAIIAIIAKI
jgi:hypothetical protein